MIKEHLKIFYYWLFWTIFSNAIVFAASPSIEGEIVDAIDWSHDGFSWTDDEPQVVKLQSAVNSPYIYGLIQKAENNYTDISYIFEYDCERDQITRIRRFNYKVWDILLHPDNDSLYSVMAPVSYRGQFVQFNLDTFTVGQEFTNLRTPSGYGISASRLAYGGPGRIILQSVGNGTQYLTPALFDLETKQVLNDRDLETYGGIATRDGITFYARHYDTPNLKITKFVWDGTKMVEVATFITDRKSNGAVEIILNPTRNAIYFDRYVLDDSLNKIEEIDEMVRLTSPDGNFLFADTKVYESSTLESGLILPDERDSITYNSYSSMLVTINHNGEISRTPIDDGSFLERPLITSERAMPDSIGLTWEDRSLEDGFALMYREVGSASWQTFSDSISKNTEEFFVQGLDSDTAYDFRLRSFNYLGESEWSQIRVSTAAASSLAQPQIVETDYASQLLSRETVWQNKPRIYWLPVEGATGYELERRMENEEWRVLITLSAEETSFFDDWLAGNQEVQYRLRAISGDEYSILSESVSIYLSGSLARPTKPENLVVVSDPSGAVRLSWGASSYETSVFVQRLDRDVWETIDTLGPDVTEYIDTTAKLGQDYTYRIGVWGRRFKTISSDTLYSDTVGSGSNEESFTSLISLTSNPGWDHAPLSTSSTFDPMTSGLYFRAPGYDIVVERIGAIRILNSKDSILLRECMVGIYDTNRNLLYAETFRRSDNLDSSGFFLWKDSPKIILKANQEYILATYSFGPALVYSLPVSLAGIMDPQPTMNLFVESRWYTGGFGSDTIEFPAGRSVIPHPTAGGNLKFRRVLRGETLEPEYFEKVSESSALTLDLEKETFSFNADLHTAYQLYFSPDLKEWTAKGKLLRGPWGRMEEDLLDIQGKTQGFYRLEVMAEFAPVFLDQQIADYIISDGFDTDSIFQVIERMDKGQAGTFQSSDYSDGIRINIFGHWQWLLDEIEPNTAVFSATLDRIEVPSLNFDGTPYQFADRFGEAVANSVQAEVKYTGFGVGMVAELEFLTDGTEIQGILVPFDTNEY